MLYPGHPEIQKILSIPMGPKWDNGEISESKIEVGWEGLPQIAIRNAERQMKGESSKKTGRESGRECHLAANKQHANINANL